MWVSRIAHRSPGAVRATPQAIPPPPGARQEALVLARECGGEFNYAVRIANPPRHREAGLLRNGCNAQQIALSDLSQRRLLTKLVRHGRAAEAHSSFARFDRGVVVVRRDDIKSAYTHYGPKERPSSGLRGRMRHVSATAKKPQYIPDTSPYVTSARPAQKQEGDWRSQPPSRALRKGWPKAWSAASLAGGSHCAALR
jgi:hypothetical protein